MKSGGSETPRPRGPEPPSDLGGYGFPRRLWRSLDRHPPPGVSVRRHWRSPLRGPWLTSTLGAVLVIGLPLVILTGLAVEDVDRALKCPACGFGGYHGARCMACHYHPGERRSVEHRATKQPQRCGACGGWPPSCCLAMIGAVATPNELAAMRAQ